MNYGKIGFIVFASAKLNTVELDVAKYSGLDKETMIDNPHFVRGTVQFSSPEEAKKTVERVDELMKKIADLMRRGTYVEHHQ